MTRLQKLEPTDREGYLAVTCELAALLERLDHHSQHETDLIQQALLQDEGGEG